jgi:hypothetical protein
MGENFRGGRAAVRRCRDAAAVCAGGFLVLFDGEFEDGRGGIETGLTIRFDEFCEVY